MKVSLPFILTGSTKEWTRPNLDIELSNYDVLECVKEAVAHQFGNRATLVQGESKLSQPGKYPEYYCAGWLISDGAPMSELVVIAHGESMDSARKSMMSFISNVDWELESVSVE